MAALGAGSDHAAAQTRYLPMGEYFVIALPEVTMTKSVEFEEEERTTPNSDVTEETLTFESEFEIGTDGWVYHPALAIYSLELRPRWQSQDIDTMVSAGEERTREQTLISLGFTFDSTFLQFKPYTLNLFASSDRSDFSSSVSPDNVTSKDIYRARLTLDYWNLPTEIVFERDESDTEGLFDFTITEHTAWIRTTHRTDESDTIFRTEYRTLEHEQAASLSNTDSFLVNAANTYKFSDDVRLASTFNAINTTTESESVNTTTSSDNTTVTASEGLFLQHAPNFSSEYFGRVEYQQQDVQESTKLFGSGTLRHRLYENLETTFFANAQHENINEGNIEILETDLNFNYQRKIPWGRVALSNGYNLRLEDDNTEEGNRDIVDESHVLTGTTLAFLENENVDTATILVTDITGLIVYTEGPDYIVSIGGDSVAISRTGVGSAIADGETVLVDYRFLADGPFTVGTRTFRVGPSLDLWDTVHLFYQYTDSQDTLFSGTRTSTLSDDVTHRFGSEVRWRWSTTRVEYETRDVSRTPLDRWLAREILRFRPLRELFFSISASFTKTDFTDTGDESKEADARMNLQWRPIRWGLFSLDAAHRRTRGDVQETDETLFETRFDWRLGLWEGDFKYEFLLQEDLRGGQRRERQVFLVEVERRF